LRDLLTRCAILKGVIERNCQKKTLISLLSNNNLYWFDDPGERLGELTAMF